MRGDRDDRDRRPAAARTSGPTAVTMPPHSKPNGVVSPGQHAERVQHVFEVESGGVDPNLDFAGAGLASNGGRERKAIEDAARHHFERRGTSFARGVPVNRHQTRDVALLAAQGDLALGRRRPDFGRAAGALHQRARRGRGPGTAGPQRRVLGGGRAQHAPDRGLLPVR